MTPIKFVKKRMPIACIFLMILLILSGCNFKSNHFGVIYITNKDIYRIPDNTQSDVEQLTFTPSIGEYQLLVSENGDKIIFKAGFGETEPESSEKRNHVYLLDTESKDFIDITNVLVEYSQVWDTFSMDWLPAQEQFMVVKYTGQEYDIESYLEFISSQNMSEPRVYTLEGKKLPDFDWFELFEKKAKIDLRVLVESMYGVNPWKKETEEEIEEKWRSVDKVIAATTELIQLLPLLKQPNFFFTPQNTIPAFEVLLDTLKQCQNLGEKEVRIEFCSSVVDLH